MPGKFASSRRGQYKGRTAKASNATVARVAASAARQAMVSSRRRAAPQAGVMAKFTSTAYKRRGTELKTLDVQFTGAYNATYTADTQPFQVLNLDTGTATVQAMSMAQQGVGIAQRDGNKLSLKSLRLRLALKANGNSNNVTTNARVLVLYDRNPNGAYVAINSILGESLQSNSIGSGTMYSNLNPNFFERFRILMDKRFTLPPYDSSGDVDANQNVQGPTGDGACLPWIIDEFIPLKDLEIMYNGTANPLTIAQHSVGALLIACYGDTAAGSAPWCLTGNARIRFHDN